MPITLTGKTGGYLVDRNSFYYVNQWESNIISVRLFTDLDNVLRKLNAVENHIGISRTTWPTTLGGVGTSTTPEHIHYIVRIGGDANNLGTLRDAVDRLRTEGDVPAWNWNFNPTIEDTWERPHSHKCVVSTIAVLELLLAIGRIVASGGVSYTTLSFGSQPFLDPAVIRHGGGGYFTPIRGTFDDFPVFRFSQRWRNEGYKFRRINRQRLREQRFTPEGTPEWVNVDLEQNNTDFEWSPGLRKSTPEDAAMGYSHPDRLTSLMEVALFRTNDGGTGLEPIEEAHQNLWFYKDGAGDDEDESVSLGEPQRKRDYSYTASCVLSVGPHRAQAFNRVSDGKIIESYDGFWDFEAADDSPDFETQFGGMDGKPDLAIQMREYAPTLPPGVDTAWGLNSGLNSGGTFDTTFDSPVWEHNASRRAAYASYLRSVEWPKSSKFLYGVNLPGDGRQRNEGRHIDRGQWRTSNSDPLEDALPLVEHNPALVRESAESILKVLTLQGAIFDPEVYGPQNLRKYWWCYPNDFGTTGSDLYLHPFLPNGESTQMAGYPTGVTDAWLRLSRRAEPSMDYPNLSSGVYTNWLAELGHVVYAETRGDIDAERTADLRFPPPQSARWLVWTSPGTNGNSPLEEAVRRG